MDHNSFVSLCKEHTYLVTCFFVYLLTETPVVNRSNVSRTNCLIEGNWGSESSDVSVCVFGSDTGVFQIFYSCRSDSTPERP